MIAGDARRTLLGGLIDYAGLFPPAALDLDGARSGYSAARSHAYGWMVDRFVCPAALAGSLAEGWPVALVAGADALTPVDADVRVVELRLGSGADAVERAREVFPGTEVYIEVPAGDVGALDAVVRAGARAKLRCGGERVPAVADVAATLHGAAERDLVLKGTAGLHHAVAAPGRHGFLNLLAACALDAPEPLREHDPAAFTLTAAGFSWRGQPLDTALARARFAGFGSCSFDEPVADLTAMGVLEPVVVPV